MAEDQATAVMEPSAVEKQPETAGAEAPTVTITKRMMVAIDESDSSFYALQWVIDHFSNLLMTTEAAEAEGGLLTVVHVQSLSHHFAAFPAGPGGATAAVYASSSMIESVKKAQQEASAALLSRALQMCRAKQIRTETLVLEGEAKDMICQAVEQMHVDLLVVGSRGLGKIKSSSLRIFVDDRVSEKSTTGGLCSPSLACTPNVPSQAGEAKDMICQAVEQMHVDLLVVGSRGLGKIKRAFIGSVSDYCAHHANCPILIVKPPKEITT
ncbi:hypothetical protein F2Q68_00032894 [Brassica cretica]|uniref:UspA domain-containing protein n=1 Tax=Brassica cretica TaxID=69181 RepID=A0A8S9GG15_BRACR|nr:hypothetical protein F2Q68_00032894 [Brassica cretica]